MTLPTPDTDGLVGAGTPFPCSLGGREYLIDLSRDAGFTEHTIPLLRAQADGSESISESSLNPEDLSRRAIDGCHHGSGQDYHDKPDSDPFRFRRSHQVEVFNKKWRLYPTQTPAVDATASLTASSTTDFRGNRLIGIGTVLFAVHGNQQVRRRATAGTWATIAGTPAANLRAWATDGERIFLAYGASGVYVTDVNGAAATSLFTGDAYAIGYVKDRLLVGDNAGNIYNPTDFTTPPNALPAALHTLAYSGIYRDFASGPNHIYMSARLGSQGWRYVIYKTTVKPDGTALDVPTHAALLPEGEQVLNLYSYLNFVLIGVIGQDGCGVRLAEPQGDGSLVIGAMIPIIGVNGSNLSSLPMVGYGRYVWVGGKNLEGRDYFGVESHRAGLVRLDLSVFNSDLQPAYAECISVVDNAAEYEMRGVALNGGPGALGSEFLVMYRQSGTASIYDTTASTPQNGARIWFGRMTYGVPDSKVAMYLDIEMDSGGGTDGGTVTPVIIADGVSTTLSNLAPPGGTVNLSAITGKEIEVSLIFNTTSTLRPSIKRVTLRSFINANRTREWVVPLIIKPRVLDMLGGEVYYASTRDEIDAIAAMVGTVAVWKLGTKTEYVTVKDYQWQPDYFDPESGQFGGLCMVKLQVVA